MGGKGAKKEGERGNGDLWEEENRIKSEGESEGERGGGGRLTRVTRVNSLVFDLLVMSDMT